MGYMLLPAIISSAIDEFTLSTTQAGLIASCLLGTLALSMFATTPFLTRIESIKITRAGALIVAIGYLLAAFAPGLIGVFLALSVAGAGMGISIAGGDAIVSARDNPDQVFAYIFALGQFTAFALLVACVPAATQGAGFKGLCLLLMAWSILMLVVLSLSGSQQSSGNTKHGHGSITIAIFISPIFRALFMIGFSDASVWPFTGEVGMSVGLDETQAQTIQGVALLAGIIGATIAGFLGTRFGRRLPIILGLSILAVMYFAILSANSAWIYSAAQIAALLFYGFSIPYLFGISSELDSSGQIMATATGMQMLGLAIGPWVAGILMSGPGLTAVGIAVVLSVIATLLLALRSLSKTAS